MDKYKYELMCARDDAIMPSKIIDVPTHQEILDLEPQATPASADILELDHQIRVYALEATRC